MLSSAHTDIMHYIYNCMSALSLPQKYFILYVYRVKFRMCLCPGASKLDRYHVTIFSAMLGTILNRLLVLKRG